MQKNLKMYGTATRGTVILAHGAGAGMDSAFMVYFAEGIAKAGFKCCLFDFPYMAKRMEDGKKRPPDRAPKLAEVYKEVITDCHAGGPLYIGGKSMGGRIASMILAEDPQLADGLILLGYPFAPPGKPENIRVEHFPALMKPTLIVQGERDVFGGKVFVESLSLPDHFRLKWVPDGDHGFKPRKASGYTETENWDAALACVTDYALGISDSYDSQ